MPGQTVPGDGAMRFGRHFLISRDALAPSEAEEQLDGAFLCGTRAPLQVKL